jgi:hypothetical protein
MDKLSKLVRRVNMFARKAENDNVIQMLYNGEVIAEYNCWGMYEPDCKTPEEWVRGCSVFEIQLRGRDIEKVELVMK